MSRVTILVAGMVVAASATPAVYQSGTVLPADESTLRINVVDYPRPVAAALRQIERQFGRVVTYEDVSYVAPGDIVDETASVRRDGDVTKRVLSMRRESLNLVVELGKAPRESQVGAALAALLAEWNGPGRSAEFRVQPVPGGYHVIPVARRSRNEGNEPYTSPLDVRITIPYEERDGLETFLVLATAISKSAQREVTPGTMPLNRLSQTRVVVGAQDENARDVLWRALQAIDPTLSWQMLCGVGERAMCGLNLHLVRSTVGD